MNNTASSKRNSNTDIARPITNNGATYFLLTQQYLESLVDRWAQEANAVGTYTPANHGFIFELVEQSQRLDETLNAGELPAVHLANMELERYDVCNAAVAAMHAFLIGHDLQEVAGV